jgi:CheR methyltransferase, all-alpha domain
MAQPSDRAGFERLLEFVRVERNFDLTGYKRSSLTRRTEKRMRELGIEGYGSYLDYLQANAGRNSQRPAEAVRSRKARELVEQVAGHLRLRLDLLRAQLGPVAGGRSPRSPAGPRRRCPFARTRRRAPAHAPPASARP